MDSVLAGVWLRESSKYEEVKAVEATSPSNRGSAGGRRPAVDGTRARDRAPACRRARMRGVGPQNRGTVPGVLIPSAV